MKAKVVGTLGQPLVVSVVPLTIVLDCQHRVAAVILHAVHAQDLQPVVQRVVTEP